MDNIPLSHHRHRHHSPSALGAIGLDYGDAAAADVVPGRTAAGTGSYQAAWAFASVPGLGALVAVVVDGEGKTVVHLAVVGNSG